MAQMNRPDPYDLDAMREGLQDLPTKSDSLVSLSLWAMAILVIIAIAFLMVWVGSASAQMRPPLMVPECSPMAVIDSALRGEYHEKPTAIGVSKNGSLIQIYSSDETGTWTVVRLTPQGCARVIDAGEGWEVEPAGEES